MMVTFCEPGPSPRGLAQDGAAADAEHDRLRVTEDGGDLVTAGALDVHEVAVGVLHEALQLVLALLVLGAGMQEVFCELQRRIVLIMIL